MVQADQDRGRVDWLVQADQDRGRVDLEVQGLGGRCVFRVGVDILRDGRIGNIIRGRFCALLWIRDQDERFGGDRFVGRGGVGHAGVGRGWFCAVGVVRDEDGRLRGRSVIGRSVIGRSVIGRSVIDRGVIGHSGVGQSGVAVGDSGGRVGVGKGRGIGLVVTLRLLDQGIDLLILGEVLQTLVVLVTHLGECLLRGLAGSRIESFDRFGQFLAEPLRVFWTRARRCLEVLEPFEQCRPRRLELGIDRGRRRLLDGSDGMGRSLRSTG